MRHSADPTTQTRHPAAVAASRRARTAPRPPPRRGMMTALPLRQPTSRHRLIWDPEAPARLASRQRARAVRPGRGPRARPGRPSRSGTCRPAALARPAAGARRRPPRRERWRDPARRPLLVVVTDGRATGGRDPVGRTRSAARRLAGISGVVVDAEEGPVRLGLAAQLARDLDAELVTVAGLASASQPSRQDAARALAAVITAGEVA